MSHSTSIEWTDATWNCLRGCSRVSEGCRNCYAEKIAGRFSDQGQPYYGLAIRNGTTGAHWTGAIRFMESQLTLPLRWRSPKRIFVNSMSDLFHEKVQDEWIEKILNVILKCPQHTFQVLTKRAARMYEWFDREWRIWGKPAKPIKNLWLGVSCEDQPTADERIPLLLQTPGAVRWVSYEPALAPVDFTAFNLKRAAYGDSAIFSDRHAHRPGLHWIVIGGESGPGARPFNIEWARDVIAQCKAAGVPCFVKQMGGYVLSRNDTGFEGDTPHSWPMDTHTEEETAEVYQSAPVRVRLKDRKGGDWNEWPEDLRVREYPKSKGEA